MTTGQTTGQQQPLQAILARGRRKKTHSRLTIDRTKFLEQYYALADEGDLTADPQSLAASALAHLDWARKRKPRSAKIRVFNPTLKRDGWTCDHTVIQTVTDDMPFLVDSLTMNLNAMDHGVHVTIHPILQVQRKSSGEFIDLLYGPPDKTALSESFIHIEIPRETRPEILKNIELTLGQALYKVRVSVEDWQAMTAKLLDTAQSMRMSKNISSALVRESCEFLEWLANDHFTLLGYREYKLVRGSSTDRLKSIAGTGLGILRDAAHAQENLAIAGQARKETRSKSPLAITKADMKPSVRRSAPLDYISIKQFNGRGQPCGERRFLGLFTSTAYSETPGDIPLLRQKITRIMNQPGLEQLSHRGKALRHILDTFPRDDLFQISLPDLKRISLGILGLQERHKLSLFLRRDTFGRFYSCLVYLPRNQYNETAKQRIESILLRRLKGNSAQSRLTISDSALARLAVTVEVSADQRAKVSVQAIQHELEEAVRTWSDKVRRALLSAASESEALVLFNRFAEHFPVAYQETVDANRALKDMRQLAQLMDEPGELEMSLSPANGSATNRVRFTTFSRDEPIQLYLAHPILENMGLRLIGENNYAVQAGDRLLWIQDFELEPAKPLNIDPIESASRFQECFARTLAQDVENDGFNSLVISAGLDWRTAALLRAYCKYILQTSNRFSQTYMLEVLSQYPALCRALLDYFDGLFNPRLSQTVRKEKIRDSDAILCSELDRAGSLDHDRILRSFTSMVRATLRTNFFQLELGNPKPFISLKLDSKKIPELPRPRPQFEIFVYSQRVEGVHLRCGEIARGGLRWSDRREDFRTEVLGLMKAQQVKNTVIVPSGAKGGFVCKSLPQADRAAVQNEVIECYKTFISGLLDVTDNIVDGQIVPPPDVITRDPADPYLVVAADKGTATFSDIANELSNQYDFWLGDAFASGGSAGYDHKKMAITARGAWEAVKRHFRELGLDTQTQEFTVIGIGDMAGDVFGNGMLLSPHIKLVAAFNHQHIFIDPRPDPALSFEERQRLANLARSSWDDYDRDRISDGGGIYTRDSKSIDLHPAAQTLLGIDRARLTPPELIRAILKMKADLLWNGGIGTYVKASREADIDAGDPVNDALRINGDELRCRVVGEGGNLGLTQLGRIEYAMSGGRINTDFIDNSAGVDSSDREVNIKILLNDAIAHQKLARKNRDKLLAEMTDDVAKLVLANNYGQTQALSMMSSGAKDRLGEHARLMRVLEGQGLLDRALEFLPAEDEIQERKKLGQGLTRPELAVILSYSKIQLSFSLIASEIPDDPFYAAELASYFPAQLTKKFGQLVQEHRLRREIIAMLISSSMINRMGPFFALRAEEETGADVAQVARAYMIVRKLFNMRQLWQGIESLDHTAQAQVQYDSMFQISRMVRRAVYWFLQRHADNLHIETQVAQLGPGATTMLARLPTLLSGRAKKRFDSDTRQFESLGLPRKIGQSIASFGLLTQILDVIELAQSHELPVEQVARLYFELSNGLRLHWIRQQIEQLRVDSRWRAVARASLRETLAQEQRDLVTSILRNAKGASPVDALATWLTDSNAEISKTRNTLDDMRSSGQLDFATLSVAIKEVRRLI